MQRQQTFRHAIGCVGVGLHSGARVGLTLRPADPGSGIRFRRVDRPGSPAIAGRLDQASDQGGVTCIGQRPLPSVRMCEHLLAAFVICGVDNVTVDVNGPELPVMDGSALPFVHLLECAGIVIQDEPVARLSVLQPIAVRDDAGEARLEPAEGLHLAIDGDAAAPLEASFAAEGDRRSVAAARAADKSSVDLVAGRLHAALDTVGDLALLPARLNARFTARGDVGPGLRHRLLRRLLSDVNAWRLEGAAPLAPFLAALGEVGSPLSGTAAPGRSSARALGG